MSTTRSSSPTTGRAEIRLALIAAAFAAAFVIAVPTSIEVRVPLAGMGWRLLLHDGAAVLGLDTSGTSGRFGVSASLANSLFDIALLPHVRARSPIFELGLPLWIPALLVGTAAWRTRRAGRLAPGRCVRCGHARGGLDADRPCPECGAPGR